MFLSPCRLVSLHLIHKDTKISLFKFKGKRPGCRSRRPPPQDGRNNRWPLLWKPPPPTSVYPPLTPPPSPSPHSSSHPPSRFTPDAPLSSPHWALHRTITTGFFPLPALFSTHWFSSLVCFFYWWNIFSVFSSTCLSTPTEFFLLFFSNFIAFKSLNSLAPTPSKGPSLFCTSLTHFPLLEVRCAIHQSSVMSY